MTPQARNLTNRCTAWGREVLGEEAVRNPKERGLRHSEEAIELAQSLGVTRQQMYALIRQVYDKPVGEPSQEVAGSLFTLYVLADVIGVDPEVALAKELERVSHPQVMQHCRDKQKAKVMAT